MAAEAIKRAGPNPTRERVKKALETLREWDTWGITPPSTHQPCAAGGDQGRQGRAGRDPRPERAVAGGYRGEDRGANGAGKTTTLKAICGLLRTEDGRRVTDGSIEFIGRRVDGLDPEDICRRGIVQVMEGRKVLETLTVEENLRIGGYTRRDADGIQQVGGYLSGGEQQMLVIGRALMARPKLLLLDEPSLGLAPLLVRAIFDIIRKIHEERGTTFLLVEQNAQMALRIADYGYIMENGRIVFDGPADKLRGNDDVREF
jgi:branched-chain amino acid transport system ATP-binding protein